MPDWFGTLNAGSKLSMDAATELQERGFAVLLGAVPSDQMERLAYTYTAAVASAVGDDISIGSTSTRVSDFVNRGASSTTCTCFRPCLRQPAASSADRLSSVLHRPSRLLKNSAKWDRQIDPVVLRCSQH